jgi:hypothetical protein
LVFQGRIEIKYEEVAVLRGIRKIALGGSVAVAFGAWAAAPSLAATPAPEATPTTLPATHVSTETATLNGSIDTQGQAVGWQFQYGPTSDFSTEKGTPIKEISAGKSTVTVSFNVTRLIPNAKYYYRLVTTTGSGTAYSPLTTRFGNTVTFHTKGLGFLLLRSTDLRVRHGRVFAKMRCDSGIACDGKFSITTRARLSATGRFGTIDCTKARSTTYKIKSNADKTISGAVTRSCMALLRANPQQSINAKFTSRPRTGQRGIISKVKLTLG